ncbi:hypothetical protein REPUB_Repub13aG0139700 [Reevesia pubescens]
MSEFSWPPYPPCVSLTCASRECCSLGYKFSWPELFGKNEQEAKATIEKDNPGVTIVIVRPGGAEFGDFCCNRVYVAVDKNGIVTKMPVVG